MRTMCAKSSVLCVVRACALHRMYSLYVCTGFVMRGEFLV